MSAEDERLAAIMRALDSPEVLSEVLRDMYRVASIQRERLDAVDFELGRIGRSVGIPSDGTTGHPISIAGILADHEQRLERMCRERKALAQRHVDLEASAADTLAEQDLRLAQLEAIAISNGQRLDAINALLGEELERAKRVER